METAWKFGLLKYFLFSGFVKESTAVDNRENEIELC